jgi:hypothetical protein
LYIDPRDLKKVYTEEIREKKKAGNGSFHKRGKGVKHGFNSALRTASYFMKAKEKRSLNGEVVVSNMYETVLHKDEFILKDEETQKLLLTRWREIYTNTNIIKLMGLSTQGYYNLIEKYQIPKKAQGGARPNTGKRKAKTLAIVETKKEIVETPEEKIKPLLITYGLHLEYNGQYTADEISKIFTKLTLLVEGEEAKFNLSLSLTEKNKN